MTGSLLSTKTVAIYGMGYVGLTLALALNEKKIEVIGIDTNQKVVEDLIRGITDIQEPYIEKKLSHSLSEGLLKVTKSINSETAKNVDVFIVTVGTPILDSRINDEAVVEVTSEIGRIMRDGSLVILRSTLEIGTTRNKIFPILNKTGKTFFLAMCPERTIEGNAIEEIAILPQVIGGINETSSDKAEKFFLSFCREVITIHNPESAELIKLANNTYRDLSFGFANELSKLCGSLGLNSREVINAANYGYPRSNIALPGPSGLQRHHVK
jgi:UDP-N-acetyl-D-mannosaminuronic acid dehydrogenase